MFKVNRYVDVDVGKNLDAATKTIKVKTESKKEKAVKNSKKKKLSKKDEKTFANSRLDELLQKANKRYKLEHEAEAENPSTAQNTTDKLSNVDQK